jgi:hypothetical protein
MARQAISKRSSTTKGAKAADHPRRAADSAAWDSDDPEIRALSRNEEFQALLRRTAERAKRDGTIPIDQMRAFRNLTPEDDAEGERLLAELERQTEEEEAAQLAARARNGPANDAGRRPGQDAHVGSRKTSKATT